ncbi:MAG: DUF4124 domain-containing protein [Gammaproteobacteria bacterium]
MMRYVIFLLIFFSLSVSYADIYMQKDSNGNTTYSDMPLNNATRIDLSNTSSHSPNFQSSPQILPDVKNSEANKTNATPSDTTTNEYTEFAINSPKDQESIQNQAALSVNITLKPTLKSGDTIQLLLDGKLAGNPSASTNLQLDHVDRGQHELSAIIVNTNQQVVKKSNSVNFFFHRVNTNFKPST